MEHKRLNFIKKLIKNNEKVLDVGTDHALIPIMLYNEKITKFIDVSDINIKPLNIAKKNIENEGIEKKINLILSNGFENINPNLYNTIIIAGMGGITISKIISSKKFYGRYILQPTTKFETLRNTLIKEGFKIKNEWIVKEGKIYNLIIESVKGKQKLTNKELFLGPYLIKKHKKIEINEYFVFLLEILIKNNEWNDHLSEKISWLKELI